MMKFEWLPAVPSPLPHVMAAPDRPWPRTSVEMPGRVTKVWDAVAAASAAIGSETFYDRLLEVLGALVETDLLALMRYSSFGAPDLIIPREIRAEVKAPYSAGLYALDPFYQYWRSVGEPAVKSLRGLATAGLWKSRYALEILRAARISDEMAIFLPPLGGASPTLILDRAHGRFTTAELARVERVFPLLASLHNAHLRAIVSRGLIAACRGKTFAPARPQRTRNLPSTCLGKACGRSGKRACRGPYRSRPSRLNPDRIAGWPSPDQIPTGVGLWRCSRWHV